MKPANRSIRALYAMNCRSEEEEDMYMFYVDLNSDLGESFGNYTLGMDEEILKYVSSANVACGWHAGDPLVMGQPWARIRAFRI